MAFPGGQTEIDKSICSGLDSRTKPWEIRNGKVLFGCLCVKRNGLQSECYRSDCVNKKCVENTQNEANSKTQPESRPTQPMQPAQQINLGLGTPSEKLQPPVATPRDQNYIPATNIQQQVPPVVQNQSGILQAAPVTHHMPESQLQVPSQQVQYSSDPNFRQRAGMSVPEQNYFQPIAQSPKYPNMGNPEGYKRYYRQPRQSDYVKNIEELSNANVNEAAQVQNVHNPMRQNNQEITPQNKDELLRAHAQLNYEQYMQNQANTDRLPQRQVDDDEPRGFPPARPLRSNYQTIPINHGVSPQIAQNQYQQVAPPVQYQNEPLQHNHSHHFEPNQNQYEQNLQLYKQNQLNQQQSQIPMYDGIPGETVQYAHNAHDQQSADTQFNNGVQQNMTNQHICQNEPENTPQYVQSSQGTPRLMAGSQNIQPQQQIPPGETPVTQGVQEAQLSYNSPRLAAGAQESPTYNTPRMVATNPQNLQSPHSASTPQDQQISQQYVQSPRTTTEFQNIPQSSNLNQYNPNPHISYNAAPQMVSPQPNSSQQMSYYHPQSINRPSLVEGVAPQYEYPPQASPRHVGQGEYHEEGMRQTYPGYPPYNYNQTKLIQQNPTQQSYQRGQGELVSN